MVKNTNLKPQRKKCKEPPYYKNYEARRRVSGKGAGIKHKTIGRKVKNIKKNPEYCGLEVYLAVALLMVQHALSYRGMVDEPNYDKTMRKKLGFSHTPFRSCIW